ncbi:hypothetical protein O2K51_10005 [Apibacter raozihei]|uniref:hypothetical protein n=1 Tax=Apibacter raozihei TaxID=2500547 RepID=UPI000FE41EAD|nr:hypothetical protein [Apibacter raozihei]
MSIEKEKSKEKIAEYLISLPLPVQMESYQKLGYTLQSILKILRTLLLTEIETPELVAHSKWDIYNLLDLAEGLLPEEELEILDQLKTKI